MSQGGLQRVYPLGTGFMRAPARVLVAPITYPFPSQIGDVVNLASGPYVTEVETATMSGGPSGGTFALAFLGYATSALPYNCTSAQMQSALEALPGIGLGNVICSGGPFPSVAITITFAGSMANLAQPLITVPSTLQHLTGGTMPAVAVTETTTGFGLYDPIGSWTDVGSTKGGVHIDRNNTETLIDVDQILTSLTALPDNWEMTVETQFAETTLENIQLAWEGSQIALNTVPSPNERYVGMGGPLFYTARRLALVAQHPIGPSAGRLVMHAFRSVTRSPVASRLTFDKTGPQQILPFTFRGFADQNIGDPASRFGLIFEQLPN
jgi:hypothetical protein